jgi:hypothetical protein
MKRAGGFRCYQGLGLAFTSACGEVPDGVPSNLGRLVGPGNERLLR